MQTIERVGNKNVFVVRDIPHFAPYLQFLVNILQIHFEHVRMGEDDHNISAAINRNDLELLYSYLRKLEPGAAVEIGERDACVLYAGFVIVSRLILCDYGETICRKLIENFPPQHPFSRFENFRNILLHHNSQMLLDMDTNMQHLIGGLDIVKQKLEAVTLG